VGRIHLVMNTCATCGEANESWEVRCTTCAVASAIPDDWNILLIGPSLWFRLIEAVKSATTFVFVGVLILIVAGLLVRLAPLVFSGTFLSIFRAVIAIAGLFLSVACISGVYVAFSEFRGHASFSVSKKKIELNDYVDLYDSLEDDVPRETKFIKADTKLADVLSTRVKQGWLARRLGYGNIEVFTDDSSRPTAIIPGVTKPNVFKAKLDQILQYRDTPISKLKPMEMPESQPNEDHKEAAIVYATPIAPSPRDLKVSLWVATPIALGVGHIAIFVVGFGMGVAENPLVGTLIAVALASWLGMAVIWDIYYFMPHSNWPLKALIAAGVSVLNGALLALSIYGLVGRMDAAALFSTVNVVIAFVGALYCIPTPTEPFLFEIFQKPKIE